MNSPKKVRKNNEQPSTSVEPFREPEGMVSIELNATKNQIENRVTGPPKSKKWKISNKHILTEAAIALLILNITVFGVLVLIYHETNIFKTPMEIQGIQEIKTINYPPLQRKTSIKIKEIKNCYLTKPLKLCCLLFEKENTRFSKLCRDHKKLSSASHVNLRSRRDLPKRSKSVASTKQHAEYQQAYFEPLDPYNYYMSYDDNSEDHQNYETPFGEYVYYWDYPIFLNHDKKQSGQRDHDNHAASAHVNHVKKVLEPNYNFEKSSRNDKNLKTVHEPVLTDKSSLKELSSSSDPKQSMHEDVVQTKEKIKDSDGINKKILNENLQNYNNNLDNEHKIKVDTQAESLNEAVIDKGKLQTDGGKLISLNEVNAKNSEDKPDKIDIPIKLTDDEDDDKSIQKSAEELFEDKNIEMGRINNGAEIIQRSSINSVSTKDTNHDPRNRDKGEIPIATIEMQSNGQTMFNPCFNQVGQVPTSYKLVPADGNSLFKIVPSSSPKFSPYAVNPQVYPYMQSPYMIPQQVIPMNTMNQQMQNTPLHVNGPGGQFYVCNPIAAPSNNNNGVANNIVNMPGVEVRRDATNLQDLLGSLPKPEKPRNNGRASQIVCPVGYEACSDDSKCVPKHQFCDNEAHCSDGSDEMFCSCKERVGKLRTCDGYFDCPNGEDELGCFGCGKDEFSCDDWSKFRKSTCIPIEQRCDGTTHCEITGKDEEDCTALTDHIGKQPFNKISNSIGFLHRNFKGKWFPTCLGSEIWAMDVCKVEAGPVSVFPKTHMVVTTNSYDGDFINVLPNNEVSFVKNCVQDRAAFVECPALFCGMRMNIKNPYRPHEVDISAENMINDLERIANKHYGQHFDAKLFRLHSLHQKESDQKHEDQDPILGDGRVVGGDPSQPAAWPWLVSIYRNGIFHCGGVLIHESWIVTAAHCTDRYWQFYFEIQAGTLRRFSFAPMEQHRWATVVISNENYDRGTLKNDIALMKLSAPVRFNRYVRPLCLPSELTAGRDFTSGPAPGTICTTVGWGATIEHGADPDHVREVEVPILDLCKHRDDREGDEICAGLSEGGKDACQGDSGGPLMCRNPNNPNQWYLAGIVSHGEGCARPDEPGVYTKVGKYVGWIAEKHGLFKFILITLNFKLLLSTLYCLGEDKFIPRFPLQHCPGYICRSSNKCLPKKHHCDKIVDCLFGDDETECVNSFQNLFKNARNSEDNSVHTIEDDLLADIIKVSDNSTETTADVQENSGSNNTNNISQNGHQDHKNNTIVDETYFACESLLQLIPFHKKCNKIVDCEDGTDESNCKCVDYVKSHNPKAVCDGITDCHDLSDEQCVTCLESEYYCRLSQKCIKITQRCDGISDCSKGEDEWDCVALTNGKTISFDSDSRPELSMSGIISINHNGIWKPYCLNSTKKEPTIASNVCNILGFEEYTTYNNLSVENIPLSTIAIKASNNVEKLPGIDKEHHTTVENGTQSLNKSSDDIRNKTCGGLFVRCSNVSLDSSVHNVHPDNVSDEVELYTAPWNAVIYCDGIYRCMGAILNSQWIVTSVNCFKGITELKSHYVAVLLGKGKGTLPVKGPHEQTLRIVESQNIPKTDIVLLRTETKIVYSRYIKHLRLSLRRDGNRKEKCVAIGLHDDKAKYEFLWPIQQCEPGFRCFETKLKTECKDSRAWSGTIVCDSGSGWYPAAVYFEKEGLCGLSSVQKYTSVPYHKREMRILMDQVSLNTDAPDCDGFRCALGECINKSKTCNGIPDCRGEEDEDSSLCYENEHLCHLTGECECGRTELKCKNKKCIPKSNFCDRKDDCGDFSDEPDVCDCRSYLELTSPEKLCDGVVHCEDRSDEDPQICPCKSNSFQCLSVNMCVPNDMVCDEVEDCPNGEDEKVCRNIVTEHNEPSNAGELVSSTGGLWHPGCFKQNYTKEELVKICDELAYLGGTANQLNPPKNVHNVTALRPVIDNFDMVWIRREKNNRLMLGVRTGNEPYVSFVPDNECFRLFLACL
ncbi:serine protease ndl [Diabrotica undecimpunctata]|uniref:serine protease ndl n=1 Tax=Diabrotica undecimpunctata TaxID=50387 RepID=UPI003B639FE4